MVNRSTRHIFVQVVDDTLGRTLVSASTMEPELRGLGEDKTAKARKVGELVAGVSFPAAGQGDRFGFHEIVRRHGDYAMAGAVVAAAGGAVRVAFFGVGDGAMRVPAAEAALGADLSGIDAAVGALSELEVAGDLNGDEATKRHLAGVALRRAVAEALA